MSIHSKYKYNVIYFFLLIHFLNLETLLSFTFQLLPVTHSTNSDIERQGTRNGPGTSQDGSNRDNDNLKRVLQRMMQSQQQQTEFLRKDCWLHPESRGQATCRISGDYNRWSFQAQRSSWMQNSGWWYNRSLEGSPSPWWEPSGSGQDTIEGCGPNMVGGGRSNIGETHNVRPVLEGFLREILSCNSSKGHGRTIYPVTTAK